MKTPTQLIQQLASVGHKLDEASDPATMRFLLRGRKALTAAIEAGRPAMLVDPPGSTVGLVLFDPGV